MGDLSLACMDALREGNATDLPRDIVEELLVEEVKGGIERAAQHEQRKTHALARLLRGDGHDKPRVEVGMAGNPHPQGTGMLHGAHTRGVP